MYQHSTIPTSYLQDSKDFNSLLPAASLSSPSKKSHLKTPPHSTRRITGLTAITSTNPTSFTISNVNDNNQTTRNYEDGDDDQNDEGNDTFDHRTSNHHINAVSASHRNDHHMPHFLNSTQHGLLSPEFSSPNLYENISSQNTAFTSSTNDDKISISNTTNIFQNSDINIKIISDSPIDNSSDKENIKQSQPIPLEAPKFTKKRSNPSSNSSSNPNKKSRLHKSPVDFILPEPHEMPKINFPSDTKPPYSYASLIGMALLRSPERRLTLAEIYQWISDNFKYYKKGEVGWQNSIRHNLSLNKAFEKTEKSKEKKGHFWQIVSGYEHIYCNIKESKRNGNSTTSTNTAEPSSKSIKTPSTPKSKLSSMITSYQLQTTPCNNESSKHDANNSIKETFITPKINSSRQNPILTVPNSNNNKVLSTKAFAYPRSRSHSRNPSANLGSIPELNIQYSSFNTSINASPFAIHYGVGADFSPNVNDSSNLDFTSSFSCRSNFELSPIRPIEPGPLLEPITPNRSNYSQNIQLPSISKQLQSFQPLIQSTQLQNKLFNDIHPTQQQHQHQALTSTPLLPPPPPPKFKTPLRISNTPIQNGNSSTMRKLWASPSYLDDFYTSPSLPRDQRDSNSLLNHNRSLLQINSNNIYGSPLPINKRRLISKANSNITNGYSTNEIFGIDVCTIHHHDDDNDR